MKTTNLFLVILAIFIVSCEQKREHIDFGKEACSFCNMTIVNHAFASQMVSSTGKNYKFDATECMIEFIKENAHFAKDAKFFVANYIEPEQMLDATTCLYLISEKIKSPMGAGVAAFQNEMDAKKIQNDFGGQLFEWNDLQNQLSYNPHEMLH